MGARKGGMEERKWGMDGAADQREPLVCLALPLKKSQENRLGVLFSPGGAHTHTHTHTCIHTHTRIHTHTHTHTHTQPPFNRTPPPLHTNRQLTNFYAAPAADLPSPEQIRPVLNAVPADGEGGDMETQWQPVCAAVEMTSHQVTFANCLRHKEEWCQGVSACFTDTQYTNTDRGVALCPVFMFM